MNNHVLQVCEDPASSMIHGSTLQKSFKAHAQELSKPMFPWDIDWPMDENLNLFGEAGLNAYWRWRNSQASFLLNNPRPVELGGDPALAGADPIAKSMALKVHRPRDASARYVQSRETGHRTYAHALMDAPTCHAA